MLTFRVIMQGDGGDVIMNGHPHHTADCNVFEKAVLTLKRWEKMSPSRIQASDDEGATWHDLDDPIDCDPFFMPCKKCPKHHGNVTALLCPKHRLSPNAKE